KHSPAPGRFPPRQARLTSIASTSMAKGCGSVGRQGQKPPKPHDPPSCGPPLSLALGDLLLPNGPIRVPQIPLAELPVNPRLGTVTCIIVKRCSPPRCTRITPRHLRVDRNHPLRADKDASPILVVWITFLSLTAFVPPSNTKLPLN